MSHLSALSVPNARTHPLADECLLVSESKLSLSNYPADAAAEPARPPEASLEEREGDAGTLDELSEELAPGISALSYDGHGDEERGEGASAE